jgi:hypothetical protein
LKAIEELGIGWIIKLNQNWLNYGEGKEFKITAIVKPLFDQCIIIKCSGCIQCENWKRSKCMTRDFEFPIRVFDVISRTEIHNSQEESDIINIVGMI